MHDFFLKLNLFQNAKSTTVATGLSVVKMSVCRTAQLKYKFEKFIFLEILINHILDMKQLEVEKRANEFLNKHEVILIIPILYTNLLVLPK